MQQTQSPKAGERQEGSTKQIAVVNQYGRYIPPDHPERTGERTQHTPGPWTYCRTWHCVAAGNVNICEMSRGDATKDEDANARLIAGAPELLAIANKIFAHPKPFGSITIDAKTVSELWAAIAKAEGRAL